ncbi:MAG: LssY C-terminal domain-containing protein [Ktedonobacterales bacterium]
MRQLLAPLGHAPAAVAAPGVDHVALPILIAAGILLVAVLLLLAFLVKVLLNVRLVRRAGAEGRRVSAEQSGTHPLTNFSRSGLSSDPLNVRLICSAGQLATAFAAAGWYRADEIDFVTSYRISIDSVFGRKYATAPVSNLYLFGRRQDFAFERPGSSVRERDHVRFWRTAETAKDGRPIWIGGATKDIAVEISKVTHLPTHRIAADTDAERTIVVEDLIGTGWVIAETWAPGFGKPTQTKNALGDPYFTDGRVAVLTLANVPVLSPLATQVRGPLEAGVAKALSRATRWRLPQSGRSRARELPRVKRAKGATPSEKTPTRK